MSHSLREMATATQLHGLSDDEAGGRLAGLFRGHGLPAAQASALRQRGNTYSQLVPKIPVQHSILREGVDAGETAIRSDG
jgi:hypothetical protein